MVSERVVSRAFVGREELLECLASNLREGTGVLTQTLDGLGGI